MSLPTKTPPNIPFDKNKNKSVRTASEITTIRKFQADSAYYYDNSETQAKDLASIYGPTIYPRDLSQSGLTLDAGRLLNTVETPLQPSSDGRILYSDILTPDAPGYDIMVMAGQSNGVGAFNNYATITPSASAPTIIGSTVRYPYTSTGISGAPREGIKAVVTGYTVSGTGFNGIGFVTSHEANVSVTIAISSSGSAINTGSNAFIRFIDYDDQLFLTTTPPTISASGTTYTYGERVGNLPTVGSTVTVQNIPLLFQTNMGFNGTGKVLGIDASGKTITVDIQSSVGGITSASYNSGNGVTTYGMSNFFTNGTIVTISGIQVSTGNASLFNISGTVGNRSDNSFTITQATGLTNATYLVGGVTSPLPTPIPLAAGSDVSRIFVISTSDVASKVFTLVGKNNSAVPAYDPLPQNFLDLYNQAGGPFGRGSLVTFGCNYANSSNLRSNRRVLLVQTSQNSRSFRTLDNAGIGWWQSTSPFVGGASYTNCVGRIQSAMMQTFGTSLPRDNRIVAVCWQEGEGDASTANTAGESQATTSALYKSDLLNFVRNLRTVVSAVSTNTLGLTSGESSVMANTFSFLVGGMTPAFVSSSQGNRGITAAAQDVGGTTICGAAVPRSAYVESLTGIDDHLPTDIHFTGTDQKIMGDRYASVFNGVVTAYTGISTVTSGTVKRFSYRRVYNLTINWTLTSPSDVTVDIYISGTASSKYGVLVNTGTVSSGTTSVVSLHKPIENVYYYAVITPTTTTLNGVPFTTSAVLNGTTAPTVASPSISIQSQKLVATWSTSVPCASLVEFFSNSTNSTSGGTFVSGVTVLPNTLTATIPNALVSRSFYYAVVTPAGGSPVTSGTVQQPITPILQTTFSTALSVVGKIDPVASTTISGSVSAGLSTSNVMTVTAGVAKIGQTLSGVTTTAGSRPLYILCAPATAPAASYDVILSESITNLTLRTITLTGCGLLTVTSGTPVAGALLTSGASVSGTRIVGPTPDPNVWVVSQSQTVSSGTTFQFSGPVDTSISKKQFKLVNAEHSSNPVSFPTDPIMNSVVYNSDSTESAGISPYIGVLGGFPGGSFTKTAWINLAPLATLSTQSIIGVSTSPFYVANSRVLRSVVSGGSLADAPVASNNVFLNGIWTHVAAVYDASTNEGSAYVNGIKDISTTYTYREVTNLLGLKPYLGSDNVKYSYANLSIGSYTDVGQFKGSMDDIRIYPIALNDAEILSVYNSKPTVTNLVTTATTTNSVSLSWTAPSGVTATSYQIQQSTDEGVTWANSTPSTSTSTSVTVTGLSPTNSRIALKVAPVVGGIAGKSAVINTSTVGSPVFQLVGVSGNPVADIVTGRTLTLSGGATLNVSTATGISGTTRNVMTIASSGFITIGGNMPAGSHSFCCWMRSSSCNVLFEYTPFRDGGGAVADPHHIIWQGSNGLGLIATLIGLNQQSHTHKAKTLRVLAGGIIECESPHGLAENAPITFDTGYFGPTGTTSARSFILADTVYYVRSTSPTQFALRASISGADISVPPIGPFVAGLSTTNNAHNSNTWVHVASVYDQIYGTITIYITAPSLVGVAPKTLVPRVYTFTSDRIIFPAVTRGSTDLFAIGRYGSGSAYTGLVDDFRAYAKALSPSEIAQIVAGTI